ncbi:MAG: helix-turn-helix transcriptional regulator [Ruminococcaceae bacterium]|nr:helix-turn-helix transcriptional regulator [Oscillospiraceae bacterium]
MFYNMKNLSDITVYHTNPKPHSIVRCRTNNAFLLRTSGGRLFDFGDKTMIAAKGQMIFLPRGSAYESTSLSEGENRGICISFKADFSYSIPSVYSFEGFPEATHIFKTMVDLWDNGNETDHYKCLSLFYTLLSYLSGIDHPDYSFKRKGSVIKPALDYLKSHLYDPSLKINSLHALCNISDTYFRKIFIANYGVTPQKYVMSKRISKATSLIESGDYNTISEVALAVGYSDPLYFSRAFKKINGTSPSDINKNA